MCASEKGDMESPAEETGRTTTHTTNNGSNKIIGRNVNGTKVIKNAEGLLGVVTGEVVADPLYQHPGRWYN
ncbi:hypothetical protein KGM_215186 [Danaus plexippus plexippus]|uniref:Uncharacterized protein n=1 Tax=Danaus plexippus plexippus TaxID=278856 RepID=A0A212EIG4_DANPL|nr:hypothetical protein KGM_215186 [Danaus plexippus plexippus]